jgi:hypothetical protein
VRSESFLLLAMAAQQFGARPSALVGLDDPVLALDFDLAAAARLLAAERAASSTGLQPGICTPEAGGSEDALPRRVREEHW